MAKIPPGVGPRFPQVVLLFGASRLPQIGSGIGEGIRNFKKSMKDSQGDKDGKSDKKEVDVTPRGDDADKK